jgi:hypothetical protein
MIGWVIGKRRKIVVRLVSCHAMMRRERGRERGREGERDVHQEVCSEGGVKIAFPEGLVRFD